MGTNEPSGDRPGEDRYPGQGSGAQGSNDPYPPYPAGTGPSYSGYREGVHGEPVPDSALPNADPTQQVPYPPPPYPPAPYGGQQWGPGGYPPYRPTNGMAVASMVLGILWIYWIGSVLALVFGYAARKQIRERGEGGDGMAVAGIVLGWIGVGVLVLFLIFFVFAGVMDSSYN